MSLHGIYLKEFVQAVATCTGRESLEVILGWLLQGDRDRLVVVNAQQQPVGLVQLSDLLPFVLPVNPADVATVQAAPYWQQPIQDLTPAVIVPLALLPADWTVAQGLPTLCASEQPHYALVNEQTQLVGLLHRDRLLQALAQTVIPIAPDASLPVIGQLPSVISPPLATPLSTTSTPQQQIYHLTQQLLAQRAELEQRLKLQQQEISRLNGLRLLESSFDRGSRPPRPEPLPFKVAAAQTPPLLEILLQLLERLPVPLMLQTSEGTVLAQNLVWCQQMGDLADPMKIWREAAVWLGAQHLAAPPVVPTPELRTRYYPTELTFQAPAIAPLPLPQDPFPVEESLCQLGSHPDNCVCVCPLKDGHERVVQFVKISLKTLLPDLAVDWLSLFTAQTPAMSDVEVSGTGDTAFHLATLTPISPSGAIEVEGQPQAGGMSAHSSPAAIAEPTLQTLWLVLAQDVTQQQHLARELTAKNADLVQLNRLKDEFLACISHELKTPLTAVLGLSSLLKDQTLGELNPRQVHYAQLIYQSSRHLMGVVNDILDLTRIETGQLELLYGTVDIAIVCSRAFDQARQLRIAESKQPAIETEALLETPINLQIEPQLKTLIADEMRLRQMLVHLLSNALKFTILQHPVGLKVSRWGGWIAFTVWDTGIGIPADKQHLIFQKFQQLENPLTRQFEGAGLGLVLTRRLARLHGGDVTFISKEGTGSQFTILLPPTPPDKTQLTRSTPLQDETDIAEPELRYPNGRVPVYAAPTMPLDRGSPAVAGMTDRLVLIVDAVAQYVEALTNKLTSLGYRVVIARSGTEALEKARRLQPCVIFLNPLLPLLSGWDVLTLLKSGTETQHLPVVVMATVIDQERAHQHQADGFLQLPVQSTKLQTLLQQLLVGTKTTSLRSPTPPLTVLRLSASAHPATDPAELLNLDELLRSQHYRILESDDVSQAELLAEVWKPNVVLLEGAIANPLDYLQHLNQHPMLAALPIVTLDPAIAQAANQIAGLQIFPCLLQRDGATTVTAPDLATLLQVIQVAAGCIWNPSILAVNLSTLAATSEPLGDRSTSSPTGEMSSFPKEAGWLQALVQYLQTAGLEGLIGHSWQDVMQQLSAQSVDVLLLCWTHGEPSPQVLAWLGQLRELTPHPPILVLDHRDPELGEATLIPLPQQLRSLATEIVTPPLSMSDLLEQIQRMLQK